ncbi:MAG: class I SAM-dependent methyltransferase [Anaerolineaceae bacterium]|nr:class I SAM-dependent methyltransferase [Anaerolineaceae bacterium]
MYDLFSSDYDRFVNWANRLEGELPFIEDLVARTGTRSGDRPVVLDAACGTGMHAVALAKRGFRTVGADLSSGMIGRANDNAREAGVDVRFETAGFGSLAQTFGGANFDVVLCLGNSLPHLLSPIDLNLALVDFANCLRPGGLLLIQNRNFDAVLANHERWMEPQSHREDEREWLFLRFYDFKPEGLINFNVVTLARKAGGAWSQRVSSSLLYPLREGEILQGLNTAGFQMAERFGNLAGAPFSAQSSGNLVVAAYRSE